MYGENESAVSRVVWTTFDQGERLPMLVGADGLPHWHITLFATTQYRNRSKAPNTTKSVLEVLKQLYLWTDKRGVHLLDHARRSIPLPEGQREDLVRWLQTKVLARRRGSTKVVQLRPRRLESARAMVSIEQDAVESETLHTRISIVAKYLIWLSRTEGNNDFGREHGLVVSANLLLEESRPKIGRRFKLNAPKGLPRRKQDALREAALPESPGNPFSNPLQLRNHIIIELLLELGLRAGELLALKVSDINFQANELTIRRRHHDPDDPREKQPVVKTLGRTLPLEDELAAEILDYVMQVRSSIPRAKRHRFLLVTHQHGPTQGQPMSYSALRKVFVTIKRGNPDVFKELHPHLLRHSANDNFSELAEKRELSAAMEEKQRSYMFGWVEGSGTSARYTRRYITEKAKEISLELQQSRRRDV